MPPHGVVPGVLEKVSGVPTSMVIWPAPTGGWALARAKPALEEKREQNPASGGAIFLTAPRPASPIAAKALAAESPTTRSLEGAPALGILSKPLEVGPSRLVISVHGPRKIIDSGPSASLTAAEEMFFFGSPLAHLLAYEAYLVSSSVLGEDVDNQLGSNQQTASR